jgi:hypothetical protein
MKYIGDLAIKAFLILQHNYKELENNALNIMYVKDLLIALIKKQHNNYFLNGKSVFISVL